MTSPFFSIIIPTFNKAHLINRTIDSVIEQSSQNYELIIVDDGSSDDTESLINSRIILNSCIKYFKKNNKGVCSARNLGAKYAIGKYLIFLDSDDVMYKDALRNFYTIAESDHYDIVFSDILKQDQYNASTKRIRATDPYGNKKGAGLYLAGAFCIKKSFFEKLNGYDENIGFGENTELKFRIDAENPSKGFTNEISIVYNDTPLGQSKNLANKVQANQYILKKHSDYFTRHPKVKQYYFQNIALAQVRLKQFAASKKSIRSAWKAYPSGAGTFIRMLIIHFPLFAKKIWN